MRSQLFITILFLLTFNAFGQKTLFHEYSPTASSWDILKWNIDNPKNVECLIEETVDENNRVTEIRFLRNGKIVDDPLCYLATKVKFEYKDNAIVEILLHDNDTLTAHDCEMWYKTKYHLNDKEQIVRVETFWKFDTESYSKESIAELKKYIPGYRDSILPVSSQMEIDYYYHSFAKMNGKYPVSKGYKLQDDYYYGDEPEKTSIIRGLEK